jgi:peptidyl-prolyl cis-trans isomerase D
MLDERIMSQMIQTSGMLDDALAGGETIEAIAKDFHLEMQAVGPVRQDGSTADNKDGIKGFEKDRTNILETVFSLESGETSSVQELSNGDYAVVRADSITPKTYKPFEAVRSELSKTWIADQEDVLNKRRVQDIIMALQASDITMEQAAKEHGASVKNLTMDNSEQAKEPMTDALQKLLFGTDAGTFQFAPIKDGYAIAIVTDVKIPDSAKADKGALDVLAKSARQNTQNEIFQILFNQLHDKHGVEINRAVLDKMYGQNPEDTPQL